MAFTKPTYQTGITKLIIVHIHSEKLKLLLINVLALFPLLETEAFSSGHNSSSTEAKHQCQLLIFQQNFPTEVDTGLLLSSSLAKCTKPEEVRSQVSSLLCLSYPSQSSDNAHQDVTTVVAEHFLSKFFHCVHWKQLNNISDVNISSSKPYNLGLKGIELSD